MPGAGGGAFSPNVAYIYRKQLEEAEIVVLNKCDRLEGGVSGTAAPSFGQLALTLRAIKDPDLHKDIVALGFVKQVRIDGGRVGVTIELTTPACPVKDAMRDQARAILTGLGASHVDVEMTAQVFESKPFRASS